MIFRENKTIKLLSLLGLVLSSFSLQAVVFGKSFFLAPPPFRPASPELVSIARYPLEIDDDNRNQFSVMLFGSATIGSGHLARYILPNCDQHTRTYLVAGEPGSEAASSNSLDLQAKYFNVLTAPLPEDGHAYIKSNYQFQSELNFAPTRNVFAINFNYRYHLSHYLDKGWWLEMVAPLVFAENNLNMTEQVVIAGGPSGYDPSVPAGYYGNMTDALKQSDWNYGKIDGKQTKFGFSDLQLRLGYVYVSEQHYFLNSYVGFSVPLSTKPSNEFLFTPTISSNHMGIFTGYSAGVRVWNRFEKSIYWIMDTAGTLLFSNNQQRSLDLQGRPWSRYLPVFLSNSVTKMNPGINSFTLPVQVTPDTIRDLNIAFVYKHNGLNLECGYHFYGRGAEKLQLLHNLDGSLAIASDLFNECSDGEVVLLYHDPAENSGQQYTKDAASIKTYLTVNNDLDAEGQSTYLPLKTDDLDLTSGAHPAMISNTLYISFGKHWDERRYPLFAGFGAGWEIGSDDAALHQALLWGRLDVSF